MTGKRVKKKKQTGKVNERAMKTAKSGRAVRNTASVPWNNSEGKRRLKSSMIAVSVFMVVFCILFGIYQYIIQNYKVTTIYVEGNVHYTNEEIISMVMDGPYGDNSLLLSLKYKDRNIEDVPFIANMNVSVLDPHTVKIEVYEKALAGYVEYLERYMYFDRDGVVIESSTKKTAGIPMVTGLDFDYVILHEPLPVEDDEIFKDILSITQLVNKYNLSIDRIYFGGDNTLTLYFEEVKVALGAREYLEEKIMQLQYMLPELSGKSGTLRMENYTEETKTITFEPD